MGDRHFDPPQEVLSNSDLIIKKVIEEYLKTYPLQTHNCDGIKKIVDNYLKPYVDRQNTLIKQKEESLRDIVKNVCDLFEERISNLEKAVLI